MSVSALGEILRKLRQDIAKRARFMNGVVIESIDANHVMVDIGKPVPAFVSPIFVPAVVVGSPVTVRIQDSHYDIVDAPQSPARLITAAELQDILDRLTALEPAMNLIPNPSPTSLTGWSSTSTHSDPDHLATDYWPADSTDESSFEAWSANTSLDIFPVPAGTGGCPVTAGLAYEGNARVLNWYGTDAAYGVTWYDSGGSSISTSVATAVAFAPDGTWMYLGSPSPEEDEKGCVPTGSFTAPSGAAYARPLVRVTQPAPGGSYYRSINVALFDFRRA